MFPLAPASRPPATGGLKRAGPRPCTRAALWSGASNCVGNRVKFSMCKRVTKALPTPGHGDPLTPGLNSERTVGGILIPKALGRLEVGRRPDYPRSPDVPRRHDGILPRVVESGPGQPSRLSLHTENTQRVQAL